MAPVGSRYCIDIRCQPWPSIPTEGFDNCTKRIVMVDSDDVRDRVKNPKTYPNKSIANNRHDKTEDVNNDIITVVNLVGLLEEGFLLPGCEHVAGPVDLRRRHGRRDIAGMPSSRTLDYSLQILFLVSILARDCRTTRVLSL